MEQAISEEPDRPRDANLERSRLIDHFKRAYQIIVGLAMTLACGKLFGDGVVRLADPALWVFGAFFITVVPIFHGGDRSLDIKYLGRSVSGFWPRAAYVWDVYMLLLTAIFFVKIAQAIPGPTLAVVAVVPGQTPPPPITAEHFYDWMAAMLVFDALVLVVDALKSRILGTQGASRALLSYSRWIVLNLALAAVCFIAAAPPAWLLAAVAPDAIGMLVFAFALGRTVLDYVFGKDFLFP